MIDTRVQADLVHDDNSSLLNLFVELQHRWRNVAGSNNIGLALDCCLDDIRMVSVRDERDDKVVIRNRGFQSIGSGDIQRDSSRVRETLGQLLRLLEGTAGNRQMVLRSAGKIFGSGTSDEATTEEEDPFLLLVGRRNFQGIPAENWSNLFIVLKQTPGKLRKDESGLVDIFVIVNCIRDLPHGNLEISLLTLRADHEADLTARVGGNGGEGVFCGSEDFASGSLQLLNQGSVQPKAFGLGRDVTSRSKGVMEELEVGFLEEGSSGTDGIGRIGDDDII